MAAMIQQVSIDFMHGKTEITFGFPKHVRPRRFAGMAAVFPEATAGGR